MARTAIVAINQMSRLHFSIRDRQQTIAKVRSATLSNRAPNTLSSPSLLAIGPSIISLIPHQRYRSQKVGLPGQHISMAKDAAILVDVIKLASMLLEPSFNHAGTFVSIVPWGGALRGCLPRIVVGIAANDVIKNYPVRANV